MILQPAAPAVQPSVGHQRSTAAHLALFLATLLAALMAGFFFAYASSVMVGLSSADDRTFIASMQAINAGVRNPFFAVAFFGAVPIVAVATILLYGSRHPGRHWTLLALLLYLSAVAVTAGGNVPLNNVLELAGAAAEVADPMTVREAFEGPWTDWNLARTALSTGALMALLFARDQAQRHPNRSA